MSVLSIILLSLIPGLIGFPIWSFYFVEQRKEGYKPTWLKIVQYLYRVILFSITWPLIGIIWILMKITTRNENRNHAVAEMKYFIGGEWIDDGKLKFTKMGGEGDFYCLDCGYKEEIVSFLHGFGENRWGCKGHQCQKCGKFHGIEGRENDPWIIPECHCGGGLSREKAVFCPACWSFNVDYHLRIMT